MTKVIQALLSGMFFTFILDFFLFLGIKQNYINTHEIALYYNILFADNQNIFIFMFFSILIGYVVIYRDTRISLIVVIPLFVISFSTLISPIGNIVAEIILMKKNVTIQIKKSYYRGDILYNGRRNITFYDYKLNKILVFDKKNIIGNEK